MKGIVADVSKTESEINKLLTKNKEHEEILTKLENRENSADTDLEEIEKQRKAMQDLITKNKLKIEKLKAKKETLENARAENVQRIGDLEKNLQAYDHPKIVLDMVYDRTVSCNDLLLHIFGLQTTEKIDLDELSKMSIAKYGKNIIHEIIKVSLPYGKRPSDLDSGMYPIDRCFRTAGNLLVPNGLAWKGKPINWNECVYKGSACEEKRNEGTELMKGKIGEAAKKEESVVEKRARLRNLETQIAKLKAELGLNS